MDYDQSKELVDVLKDIRYELHLKNEINREISDTLDKIYRGMP